MVCLKAIGTNGEIVNISGYSIEALLLTAIRSEIDSRKIYNKHSKRAGDAFLAARLQFLAQEEEKHKILLQRMYHRQFPEKKMQVPKKAPVPIPEMELQEDLEILDLIERAMYVELSARDYYLSVASRVQKDSMFRRSLTYLASMELGHYKILEVERDRLAIQTEFGGL